MRVFNEIPAFNAVHSQPYFLIQVKKLTRKLVKCLCIFRKLFNFSVTLVKLSWSPDLLTLTNRKRLEFLKDQVFLDFLQASHALLVM